MIAGLGLALSTFELRSPLRTCRRAARRPAPGRGSHVVHDNGTARTWRALPIAAPARHAAEIQKATHTLLNFPRASARKSAPIIEAAVGPAFLTPSTGFCLLGARRERCASPRTPGRRRSAAVVVRRARVLQIGGEVTDRLVVLNSQEPPSRHGDWAQHGVGVVPRRRTAGDGGASAVFSYAHSTCSRALRSSSVLARPDCNRRGPRGRRDSGGVEHLRASRLRTRSTRSWPAAREAVDIRRRRLARARGDARQIRCANDDPFARARLLQVAADELSNELVAAENTERVTVTPAPPMTVRRRARAATANQRAKSILLAKTH